MVRTGHIIPSATTAIEADHHISVKQLSAIHMTSFGMTCCFLHKQLGLVKKVKGLQGVKTAVSGP
jgi:hypothetical protein